MRTYISLLWFEKKQKTKKKVTKSCTGDDFSRRATVLGTKFLSLLYLNVPACTCISGSCWQCTRQMSMTYANSSNL